MACKQDLGALAGATGAGKPIHATAEGFLTIPQINARNPRLQIRLLMRFYSLTETQANTCAAVIGRVM